MIFSPEDFSSINHSCTLQTILSIEHFIEENSGLYSKTELWNVLPKKIMYQSYKIVLAYLEYLGKIQIQGKKVVWVGSGHKFLLESFKAQNHACTLSTICSIEKFLTENSGLYSKTDAWENLPKKIMYQSYKVVIEYLIFSGKLRVENRKLVSLGGGAK